MLTNLLEREKVFCIASNDDADEVAGFFYGQEKQRKMFVLIELVLVRGDHLTLNVKTQDKQLLKEFVEFIKELLSKNNF